MATGHQRRSFKLVHEQHIPTVSSLERRNFVRSDALRQVPTYATREWVRLCKPRLPVDRVLKAKPLILARGSRPDPGSVALIRWRREAINECLLEWRANKRRLTEQKRVECLHTGYFTIIVRPFSGDSLSLGAQFKYGNIDSLATSGKESADRRGTGGKIEFDCGPSTD